MCADRETAGYQAVADLLVAMESAMGVDELAQLGAGTALQVLTAASASVSRFDAAAGSVRTLVNVGALGPGEQEHPADERYRVSDFPNLLKVAEQQRPWSLHLHDQGGDPSELRLLASLGKAASLGCPILVGARVWGEVYATRQHGSPAFTGRDEAVSRVIAQAIALGIGRLNSHELRRKPEHLTELVYIQYRSVKVTAV